MQEKGQTVSVFYSVTLTLQPNMYRNDPSDQYDQSRLEILTKLELIRCLVKEATLYAELTASANVHWHGWIQFYYKKESPTKFTTVFHNLFRHNKIIGFVNIGQSLDLNGWKEYCTKDQFITHEELKRVPILRYKQDDIDPLNLIFFDDYRKYNELCMEQTEETLNNTDQLNK